jgi:hypothetical protein
MVPSFIDPRLADPLVLVLAARRLRYRQDQPPLPDWEKTEGLCALLEHARRLPPRDPEDLEAVPLTGMGRLLQEARAWIEAQEQDAC